MRNLNLNIRLLIVFGILLIGSFVSESYYRKATVLPYKSKMLQSVELTKRWFAIIEQLKIEKGIKSDAGSRVPNSFMIGDEWSVITTSLGSLESKETSTNPDFSALVVRLLKEANINKGSTVGVILSGSFPSLAISTLAALQILEIDAVVFSSVGSSTYGANQVDVTWIDMESNLQKRGGLKIVSNLVSIGSQDDSGKDLLEEGISSIKNAALRNSVILYEPKSLKESIDKKLEIFQKADISLLINIGGNQTSLGECAHSTMIPNGLHFKIDACKDSNRGLIVRLNELGVPFINMLDIKDLASRYGIAISPGKSYAESTQLYTRNESNRNVLAIIFIICVIPLYFLKKEY